MLLVLSRNQIVTLEYQTLTENTLLLLIIINLRVGYILKDKTKKISQEI